MQPQVQSWVPGRRRLEPSYSAEQWRRNTRNREQSHQRNRRHSSRPKSSVRRWLLRVFRAWFKIHRITQGRGVQPSLIFLFRMKICQLLRKSFQMQKKMFLISTKTLLVSTKTLMISMKTLPISTKTLITPLKMCKIPSATFQSR